MVHHEYIASAKMTLALREAMLLFFEPRRFVASNCINNNSTNNNHNNNDNNADDDDDNNDNNDDDDKHVSISDPPRDPQSLRTVVEAMLKTQLFRLSIRNALYQ